MNMKQKLFFVRIKGWDCKGMNVVSNSVKPYTVQGRDDTLVSIDCWTNSWNFYETPVNIKGGWWGLFMYPGPTWRIRRDGDGLPRPTVPRTTGWRTDGTAKWKF